MILKPPPTKSAIRVWAAFKVFFWFVFQPFDVPQNTKQYLSQEKNNTNKLSNCTWSKHKLGYGLFQNVKISKNTEFSTGLIRWRWKLVLSIELRTHSVSNSKLHLKLKSKVKYDILWNTYEQLLMQSQVKRWNK